MDFLTKEGRMFRSILTIILFCLPMWSHNIAATPRQQPARTSFTKIVVTSPQANALWMKNQPHTIKWNKFGQLPGTVRIVLSNVGGTKIIHEIKDPAPNSGSFQWTIPASIPPGKYKIMVRASNTQISDLSDEFTITQELKARPVDLSSKQVIVTNPQENRKYAPRATIPINWETELPKDIPSTADVLFFDIDIYGPNGATKIYTIAKKEHWRSYHLSGNRYRTTWHWNPTEANAAIRTGYYKIKISPKYAADNYAGMPGFSGKIHLSRGVEKVTGTLNPRIRNRFSRKQEYYTVTKPLGVGNIPPGCENKPGTARVGFHNYYDPSVSTAGSYAYRGFVFRSRLIFNLEEYKRPGRLLLKAELRLTAKHNKIDANRNSSCGGGLYYLTGPWEGKCLDTPGYLIAVIPDQVVFSKDVTQFVQNWYTGSEPNHGFILTGVTEDFVHNDRICVTWYEAVLIVEFLEGNKD